MLSRVRWVFGSTLHGGPIELFLVLASALRVAKAVCYPVSGMMHIKEPLLLIRKSSLCGGSRSPLAS